MKYFNGFSLQNEEKIFDNYLTKSVYTVAGFSYGAQLAFEYAYASTERIEKLILLSPAFFQTQKPSFIRTQLRYFEAGQEAYVKQFLSNVAYPSNINLSEYLNIGTKEELEALLTYTWDEDKLQELIARGITIEVFFGEKDKILDTQEAIDFFKKRCTLYSIKESGHLLLEN
ncbi:pimelyl-ACP methyl ester esterase BioV [Sulfurovum sp.]|uniref:pimelyl-ACP methyl ester esterase BioV n=1 Tax=Sulfurovum sp. TaxID=1969726 RepID=UPI002867F2C9|nr:pimelyl-ACP methyl ester esterase BioV [Sulfurovum sp.]